MFRYLVKNRHGYVTVMLIAMLISVLFFNTSFLEIARYKSIEKLYGEIQENAAFSILANYDRDLLSKYGLLAVEDDIDSDKLKEYIQADINGGAEDINKVDSFLGESTVEAHLQKLYFLSQKDVFVNQINEFCAYRAPMALIDNGLNLEDTLQQLIKDLESSLSALKSFKSFTDAADKTLDAYIAMIDFVNLVEKTYFPAVEKLAEVINAFNDAIDKREEIKESIKAQEKANEEAIENGNPEAVVDISALQSELISQCTEVQTLATKVSECIDEMVTVTEEFEEVRKSFFKAWKKMVEAEESWSLDGAKADEDVSDMAQTMEKTYNTSKEDTEKAIKPITLYEDKFFGSVKLDMNKTKTVLALGSGESLEKLAVNSGEKNNPFNLKLDGNLASTTKQLIAQITGAEEDLQEKNKDKDDDSISLHDIIAITKLLVELTVCGGRFNIDCKEVLNVDLMDFENTTNDYADTDQAYVDGLLQEVEETLEIDIDINGDFRENETLSALETALAELSNKSNAMQQDLQSFEIISTDLMGLLEQLKGVIVSVVEFFEAAINAITALVSYAVKGLMEIIYKRLYAATYATEMFTNRSSSLENDKRMNGSSYKDYGDDTNQEVFYMANAEFIYGGTKSEILNQELVFLSIYGLRIFANIPAILQDTTLHEVSVEVAAIPVVGPVLSVVLYVLIIAAEAYLDMIFMIYGEDGVSILKMTGYLNFNGKGIDELMDQVKGMIKKLSLNSMGDNKKVTKELKESWSSTLSDAKDNLTKWDYKDHLFLILCFFKTTNSIYQNEARLIQLQLDKEKEEDFRLSNMATFVRTDTTVKYEPLLPVPYYGDGISIHKLYYTGY